MFPVAQPWPPEGKSDPPTPCPHQRPDGELVSDDLGRPLGDGQKVAARPPHRGQGRVVGGEGGQVQRLEEDVVRPRPDHERVGAAAPRGLGCAHQAHGEVHLAELAEGGAEDKGRGAVGLGPGV